MSDKRCDACVRRVSLVGHRPALNTYRKNMFTGRIWKFGHNVNTDSIISGKYLTISDPHKLAKHIFETVRPELSALVRRGDMIVAGRNFGCGSSREHAPCALKSAGISAIIAISFGRIFYRNAINLGLPVIECNELWENVCEGETITVDIKRGRIQTEKNSFSFSLFPEHISSILKHGGLVNKLRYELERMCDARNKVTQIYHK